MQTTTGGKPLPAHRQSRAGALYQALTVYLVCGFIGWVYETVFVLLDKHHLQARGFVFVMQPLQAYVPALSGTFLADVPLVWGLPFIQIYAIGGAVMCLAFRRWRCHPLPVFFAGAVGLSVLEYIAGWFCDHVLHQIYWDYSAYPLNLNGYVYFGSTLAWGVLSVLAVKLVEPAITRFYNRENARHAHFHALVGTLFVYTLACGTVKFFIAPGIVPPDK